MAVDLTERRDKAFAAQLVVAVNYLKFLADAETDEPERKRKVWIYQSPNISQDDWEKRMSVNCISFRTAIPDHLTFAHVFFQGLWQKDFDFGHFVEGLEKEDKIDEEVAYSYIMCPLSYQGSYEGLIAKLIRQNLNERSWWQESKPVGLMFKELYPPVVYDFKDLFDWCEANYRELQKKYPEL